MTDRSRRPRGSGTISPRPTQKKPDACRAIWHEGGETHRKVFDTYADAEAFLDGMVAEREAAEEAARKAAEPTPEERAQAWREARKKRAAEYWQEMLDPKQLQSVWRHYRESMHRLEFLIAEEKKRGHSESLEGLQRAYYLLLDHKSMTAPPETCPENVDIACDGVTGNLKWTVARKRHYCAECGGVAAEEGDEYLRDEHRTTYSETRAWCRECAWRLFGPNGVAGEPWYRNPRDYHRCGRGCLLDGDSPEWEAAQERKWAGQDEEMRRLGIRGPGTTPGDRI